jgi:hypothetical protein
MTRPWEATDDVVLDEIDTLAFGTGRQRLVRALRSQSEGALVAQPPGGPVLAGGLIRQGARAFYLGPVVAANPDAGMAVTQGLLQRARGARVFWDLPEANQAASRWAREHGFVVQRGLTRMYWGQNDVPGDPKKQFALTGPETG